MSETLSIRVATSKGKVSDLTLSKTATIADLKKEYAKVVKKTVHRLSFKRKNGTRLDDDRKTLISYEVVDGETIDFKDLGPQIGYQTVFVVEYAGPMIFMMIYALRPSFIFGTGASDQPYNWVAKLAIVCWVLHFLKRELETFFVHKFSRYDDSHSF